jgi:hypothetical protein
MKTRNLLDKELITEAIQYPEGGGVFFWRVTNLFPGVSYTVCNSLVINLFFNIKVPKLTRDVFLSSVIPYNLIRKMSGAYSFYWRGVGGYLFSSVAICVIWFYWCGSIQVMVGWGCGKKTGGAVLILLLFRWWIRWRAGEFFRRGIFFF